MTEQKKLILEITDIGNNEVDIKIEWKPKLHLKDDNGNEIKNDSDVNSRVLLYCFEKIMNSLNKNVMTKIVKDNKE